MNIKNIDLMSDSDVEDVLSMDSSRVDSYLGEKISKLSYSSSIASTVSLAKDNNQQEKMQLPRFAEIHSPKKQAIGFFNCFNNKPIMFSSTKLKKAQQFFDNDPFTDGYATNTQTSSEDQSDNPLVSFINNTINIPPIKSIDDDFIPSFNFGGGKKAVLINQQLCKKAQEFFSSKRKETKKNKKLQTQSMLQFRKVDYQTTIPCNKKNRKRFASIKRKSKSKQKSKNKDFLECFMKQQQTEKRVFISLKDIKYPDKLDYSSINAFTHYNCPLKNCLFCLKNFEEEVITKENIIEVVRKNSQQEINDQKYRQLYQLIVFKLFKYSKCIPVIQNKQLHPHIITMQLYKKILKISRGYGGFLSQCLRNPHGQQIRLSAIKIIKKQKYEASTYYVLLTDGWTKVWSAIRKTNYLFNYLHKVKIGSKIEIVGWIMHPISNILDFCPDIQEKQMPCIQFFYNGSRLLQPFEKLGKAKQLFYRPLNKCKVEGGIISLVQGIVVRIFTIANKKTSSGILTNQFIELLTYEGTYYYMKFNLPGDMSLIQLFRLYHGYHFTKIKIDQQGLLYFIESSRQVQIKDQSKNSWLSTKLQSRLLIQKNNHQLQNGKLFDVYSTNGIVRYQGQQITIQDPIQSESVYFQYLLNIQREKYILCKTHYSSHLKKLTKLYKNILTS